MYLTDEKQHGTVFFRAILVKSTLNTLLYRLSIILLQPSHILSKRTPIILGEIRMLANLMGKTHITIYATFTLDNRSPHPSLVYNRLQMVWGLAMTSFTRLRDLSYYDHLGISLSDLRKTQKPQKVVNQISLCEMCTTLHPPYKRSHGRASIRRWRLTP